MPLVSNAIKTNLYDLRIIYLPNSYQLRCAQTRQSARSPGPAMKQATTPKGNNTSGASPVDARSGQRR